MKIKPNADVDGIVFDTEAGRLLHLKSNGDILVRGKKVTNNKEIVMCLKFLVRNEPEGVFYSAGRMMGIQIGFMIGSISGIVMCIFLIVLKYT